MQQFDPDFMYPPVKNGSITEIYPWVGFLSDHIDFFKILIGHFFGADYIKKDQEIKKFLKAENVYLLDSGRSSIFLVLKAINIQPGEEVIISAFNCPAVAEAIVMTGAVVKFVDVNQTGGLSIEGLEKALSPKTRAVLATNVFGIVDSLELIADYCKNNKLIFINDLAQAFENPTIDFRLNTFGDACIYSFGPEKQVFALGGGALVCSENLNDKVKRLLPKNQVSFIQLLTVLVSRYKYYLTFLVLRYSKSFYSFFVSIGIVEKFSDHKGVEIDIHPIIPSLMHPVQKSVLVRKLKHFVTEDLQTRHNFKILKQSVNAHFLDAKINNHLYATILLDATSRYEFSRYLSEKGIQSVWNYIPLYYSKVLHANPSNFPNTEKLWRQVLSVPFRYPIKQSRVEQIASIINSYHGYANKKNQ